MYLTGTRRASALVTFITGFQIPLEIQKSLLKRGTFGGSASYCKASLRCLGCGLNSPIVTSEHPQSSVHGMFQVEAKNQYLGLSGQTQATSMFTPGCLELTCGDWPSDQRNGDSPCSSQVDSNSSSGSAVPILS